MATKRVCEINGREYGAAGWAFHAGWCAPCGLRVAGKRGSAGRREAPAAVGGKRHECKQDHPGVGHVRAEIRARKIAAENADGATRGPASPRVGKRASKRAARRNAQAAAAVTPTHPARPAKVLVTSGRVDPARAVVVAKPAAPAVAPMPTYSLAQVSADVLALTSALTSYATLTEGRFDKLEDGLQAVALRMGVALGVA